MSDPGQTYSAEQAAHELVGPHRPLADARALVRGYLDEVSERVGVPVHQWGLDEADLAEIESDQMSAGLVQVAGDGLAGEPAGAVRHAHGAVAVERAHHAVAQGGEDVDLGESLRREQLAQWATQDDIQDGRTATASAGDGSTAGGW